MSARGLAASLVVLAIAAAASGCARGPAPAPSPVPPAPATTSSVTPTVPVTSTTTPAPTATPAPRPAPTPGKPAPSTTAPADNKTRSWYYLPNSTHRVPAVASGAKKMLATFGGRYTGPDSHRVYLTFDQGYENGNTPHILDALARNGVKATFFVTASYVKSQPALVRRMVREGHVVGNHSATHPSMPSLAKDRAAFKAELTKTADAFRKATGKRISAIFRPPAGAYSPLSLWLTWSLGYETVFWSFAHRDWITDDQPPVKVTLKRILDRSHPGAIFLLHGVSSSDTAALDDAIAGLRAQGYRFGTLGDR
jgi:peptidoglycan-N-acetylmuramic acid deacetylase